MLGARIAPAIAARPASTSRPVIVSSAVITAVVGATAHSPANVGTAFTCSS